MNINNKIKPIINKLKKRPEVLAVYLFGSSIHGKKGKLSDLDVGVIFYDPQQILKEAKHSLKAYGELFDIFAPLANILTGTADKLDLVFLQRTPLTLQKEVLLKGKLIYVKNQEKFLDYKEKTLLSYADLKPVINYFHQKIFERGIYGKKYLKTSS